MRPGPANPVYALDGMTAQQASVLAFDKVFYLIGMLFFVCLPLVLFLKAGQPPEGHATEPVEV